MSGKSADEKLLCDLSYAAAILYCCNNIGLSIELASLYVQRLGKLYPESHLGAHIRFLDLTRPTQSCILDDNGE